MGLAISRLALKVALTRVWVPPYVRVRGGRRQDVDGYWREVRGVPGGAAEVPGRGGPERPQEPQGGPERPQGLPEARKAKVVVQAFQGQPGQSEEPPEVLRRAQVVRHPQRGVGVVETSLRTPQGWAGLVRFGPFGEVARVPAEELEKADDDALPRLPEEPKPGPSLSSDLPAEDVAQGWLGWWRAKRGRREIVPEAWSSRWNESVQRTVEAPPEVPPAAVKDVEAVVGAISEVAGRQPRWSGKIEFNPDTPAVAYVKGDTLYFGRTLVTQGPERRSRWDRFRVLAHEAAHMVSSKSPGMEGYMDSGAWEEGLAEGWSITHLGDLAERSGLGFSREQAEGWAKEVLLRTGVSSGYRDLLDGMLTIADALHGSFRDDDERWEWYRRFFDVLLRVPIFARAEVTEEWVEQAIRDGRIREDTDEGLRQLRRVARVFRGLNHWQPYDVE